ncbi:SU10 major capsid protein [Paenibacillus cellulositrophicus]|uniref:SU10 major capsid protein n=1 Tax=Paenibacillus cellulositrophicus TaxID=562959 RepID=UPI003F80D92C
MFKTNNLTAGESISLAKEIVKIGITDTPLTSLIMAKGLVEKANGTVHTWREKSYSNDADVSVIEGNEDVKFYQSGRAEMNNVLELFQKGVSVSGTANAINVQGQGNIFSSEVADRLTELKVNIEKQVTKGVKNDGSATPFIRRMAGLETFADANNLVTGAASGVITEAEIKATVKKLWDQGLPTGEYFGLVNADIKEQIDALYKGSYTYSQTNVFGIIVDVIRTNYGNLNLLLSRHASADKMTVFDASALSLAFLREAQFEALAKTGDSVKGQVIAEGTLKVASKKAVAQYTLKA